MTLLIVSSVLVGVFLGRFVLPSEVISWLDSFVSVALGILVLGVGIELGQSGDVLGKIRTLGWKLVWVPLVIGIGSIGGAVVMGRFLGLPFNESSAVGAGFGWYSLSGVLLTQIYRVDTGALAFLANVFREVLAIITIPIVAKFLGNLEAIAPGGATTMDVTLPLISKTTDEETTIIAFVTGAVLSAVVPILVPFFIGLVKIG